MYTSLMKGKIKIRFVDVSTLEDELVFEEANVEAEIELQSLYEENGRLPMIGLVRQKIFHLYCHNTDMSIRTLADENKISARSIFNTLKMQENESKPTATKPTKRGGKPKAWVTPLSKSQPPQVSRLR